MKIIFLSLIFSTTHLLGQTPVFQAKYKNTPNYAYYDTTGNKIHAEEFARLGYYEGGLNRFISPTNEIGFINLKGEVVIKPQFRNAGDWVNGFIWVKTSDELIGIINTNGEWIVKPFFDMCKDFHKEYNIARMRKNGVHGYVNTKGEYFFLEGVDDLGDFYNGLCWGRKNGLIGFFDLTGKWIVEPKYEVVRHFKNGYACVSINKKWGIINSKGELIVETKFDDIKDVELVK